jgi:hypothetical protein
MENTNPEKAACLQEIGTFFKEDLLKIFFSIFKNPFQGLTDYYQSKTKNGLLSSIILIAIAVILFVFVPYLGIGEMRSYIPFKFFLLIGLAPILVVGFVTIFTFLVKSLIEKTDFMKEFEWASFQTVMLSVFMIVLLLLFVIVRNFDPFSSLVEMNFFGVIYLLFISYLLLMMICTVKQSLLLNKINPVLAWYVSPAAVLLSVYLSSIIITNLISNKVCLRRRTLNTMKMKNRLLIIVSVFVCGIIFWGCGGGSISGLKKNKHLGNLPAIYADYELTKKVEDAKAEKTAEKYMAKGDYNSLMKMGVKFEKLEKERKLKFQTEEKAEWEKIKGNEVPFTVSEAFGELSCKIESVVFADDPVGIVASIVAKEDFQVNSKNQNDYTTIYYRVVDSDGLTIERNTFYLFYLGWREVKSFKQGELLKSDGEIKDSWSVRHSPVKWENFSGIEFLTKDEYDSMK